MQYSARIAMPLVEGESSRRSSIERGGRERQPIAVEGGMLPSPLARSQNIHNRSQSGLRTPSGIHQEPGKRIDAGLLLHIQGRTHQLMGTHLRSEPQERYPLVHRKRIRKRNQQQESKVSEGTEAHEKHHVEEPYCYNLNTKIIQFLSYLIVIPSAIIRVNITLHIFFMTSNILRFIPLRFNWNIIGGFRFTIFFINRLSF